MFVRSSVHRRRLSVVTVVSHEITTFGDLENPYLVPESAFVLVHLGICVTWSRHSDPLVCSARKPSLFQSLQILIWFLKVLSFWFILGDFMRERDTDGRTDRRTNIEFRAHLHNSPLRGQLLDYTRRARVVPLDPQ